MDQLIEKAVSVFYSTPGPPNNVLTAGIAEDGLIQVILNGEDITDTIVDGPCCSDCDSEVCLTVVYSGMLKHMANRCSKQRWSNKRTRFFLYKTVTRWMHGFLGPSERRPIPPCLVSCIRDLVPEQNIEDYVGFKEA